MTKNAIEDKEIDTNLYKHYQILMGNLEYHLLGNHLLENSFALLFGSYYFEVEAMYQKDIDRRTRRTNTSRWWAF